MSFWPAGADQKSDPCDFDSFAKELAIVEKLAPPTSRRILKKSMSGLLERDPDAHLFSRGGVSVYSGKGKDVPQLMKHLGHLREKTFRHAKEGTGAARDLDKYDAEYDQIWMMDDKSNVFGGMRMTTTSRMQKPGMPGLYTQDQITMKPGFFKAVGNTAERDSAEVGRTFVTPEMQSKNLGPLLFKGVAAKVQRNPQIENLYGVVSVSNTVPKRARMALMAYLEKNAGDKNLAKHVEAKNPIAQGPWEKVLTKEDQEALNLDYNGFQEHFSKISNGEPIPELFKFYYNMGAKFLVNDVDDSFGSTDSFIVLNMVKLLDTVEGQSRLKIFMGPDGMKKFAEHHGRPLLKRKK